MKTIVSICVGVLLFLLLTIVMYSCTPTKVVETVITDSTGKQVKVRTKYYDQSPTTVDLITPPIYRIPYYPLNRPIIVYPLTPRFYYRPIYRRRY